MAQRRRILHTVRQFTPSVGGLENYVAQLTQRQRRHSDVEILTLNRLFRSAETLPATETIDDVLVRRVPYVGRAKMFFPFLDRRLFENYDVIHMHAADQLLDLGAAQARRLRKPHFIVSHGLFFHTPAFTTIKKVYLRRITRKALLGADAVFAVSSNDLNTIRSVGVEATLLRNPIEPFPLAPVEGQDLIFIGRLSENKRVDRLIAFLAALRPSRPDIALHVVGADTEGAGAALAAAAARLGVAEHVTFHGYISREALTALLARCRYVVSASQYEGFGLSVVEAMSAGLIPFLEANDAFEELWRLSGVGSLTAFDDLERAVADFTALAATVGREDRERARAFGLSHSWDDVEATIEAAYAKALEARQVSQ